MSNLDLFGRPPRDRSQERSPREPRVYQVRELNLEAGRLLEQRFPIVRVEGEISGWTRHRGSGHCYFALKDDTAELRCVLFQSQAARLSFEPSDGLRVVATGRVTIYPDRGQYQLRALDLAPAGLGALMQALQELKGRLAREGLFEEARKRALPRFPRTVGVVTSPSGAAVRDVVRVLRARWPAVEIVLAPVSVQGPGSAADIVHGIHKQAWWDRAEVLIVGRGGGSLEDLWAFNEEIVVRAVAASPIPIISAVGHETDITLTDLAADVRAATPSRAAELAVPEVVEVRRLVGDHGARLRQAARHDLLSRRDRLRRLAMSHGLHRPRTVVEHALQRVDDLGHRFAIASGRAVEDRRSGLRSLGIRLRGATLGRSRMARSELGRLWQGLRAPGARFPERESHRVRALEGKLGALDPTRVLGRGYALVAGPDGTLIRDGGTLRPGERIRMRFHRGGATGTVSEAWADEPGSNEVETA